MKKVLIAFLFCTLIFSACAKKNQGTAKINLKPEVCPKEQIKYDDGDSFFCGDEYIRIVGYDAPEIIHKEHGIYENQEYGPQAAEYFKDLMKKSSVVTMVRVGLDKYNRTLAFILLDGELVDKKMIKAGLGYECVSFYGDNGHPEFASQILEAASGVPEPKFEPPFIWRRYNQKKVPVNVERTNDSNQECKDSGK